MHMLVQPVATRPQAEDDHLIIAGRKESKGSFASQTGAGAVKLNNAVPNLKYAPFVAIGAQDFEETASQTGAGAVKLNNAVPNLKYAPFVAIGAQDFEETASLTQKGKVNCIPFNYYHCTCYQESMHLYQ